MSEIIDRRIAELENELAGLRRQKLSELQTQVAALEASLTGAAADAPRRGRPPGRPPGSGKGKGKGKRQKTVSGWAAELAVDPQAMAGKRGKRRGRPRGKRVSDEEALAKVTKLVTSAGKEGTSARKVSLASGLFYPRVIALMNANFKKSGEGKWTRYTIKK